MVAKWPTALKVQFLACYIGYGLIYTARKPFSTVKKTLTRPYEEGGIDLGEDVLADMDTAFSAAYAGGMFIFVPLAEKIGVRYVVPCCFILSGLMCFLFGQSDGPTTLTILWFFNGLLHSVCYPLMMRLLLPWVPSSLRGSMMGIWSTCQPIGSFLATTLASYIVDEIDWRWTFYIPSMIMATVGVGLLLTLQNDPPPSVVEFIEDVNQEYKQKKEQELAAEINAARALFDAGNEDDDEESDEESSSEVEPEEDPLKDRSAQASLAVSAAVSETGRVTAAPSESERRALALCTRVHSSYYHDDTPAVPASRSALHHTHARAPSQDPSSTDDDSSPPQFEVAVYPAGDDTGDNDEAMADALPIVVSPSHDTSPKHVPTKPAVLPLPNAQSVLVQRTNTANTNAFSLSAGLPLSGRVSRVVISRKSSLAASVVARLASFDDAGVHKSNLRPSLLSIVGPNGVVPGATSAIVSQESMQDIKSAMASRSVSVMSISVASANGAEEQIIVTTTPTDDAAIESAAEEGAGEVVVTQTLTMWQIVTGVPFILNAGVTYFFVGIVRYGLLQWLTYYLGDLDYENGVAGYLSTMFDVGGIFGAILSGVITDKVLKGQRALTVIYFLIFAVAAIIFFAETASVGVGVLIVAMVLLGLSIVGPDSILGSPLAADLCEMSPFGAAALGPVAGIINGMGALGSVAQAKVIIALKQWEGWRMVYYFMALVCGLGAIVLLPPMIRYRKEMNAREAARAQAISDARNGTGEGAKKKKGGKKKTAVAPLEVVPEVSASEEVASPSSTADSETMKKDE